MHISDMLGQYNRNVSSGTEELKAASGMQKVVSTLEELSSGSVFEGTVSSVKNGKVTLALSDGQTISARLSGKVQLSQGTPMFFQVKSNDGETIEIKPYTGAGSGGNPILTNALAEGNVPVTERNLAMFDAMMKEQMPIDKQSLMNMARIANTLVNDPDKIKTAAGLLMTMNGSPFVYYGEEIGMNSSGTKDENKRIPMVWSKTDTTGMTKGPADMDAGIESPFPAEDEQEKDKDSILSYYKNALRLRNQNPEIARGTIEKVESLCKDSQAAITKTYQDSTIGIVYNLGEGNDTVDLKGTALENMNLEGSLTLKEETVQLKDGKLEMPPCSIVVLK